MADTGSLAGAARAVQLSSAAVAEQIQALERELGVGLIKRQGRTATLTDEGRAVVDAGRDILARVADLNQIAQLGRLRGNLRIGSVSTALISIVPGALRYMAKNYPDISLKIVPGTSLQLYRMLESDEIDCAITIKPRFSVPKEFGWRLIRLEPLVLIGPLDPTCSSMDDYFAAFPMIRMYRNSPTGRIVSEFLAKKGIVPNELFEIEAADMIVLLVSQGLGISLLPDYGFEHVNNRPIKKISAGDRSFDRPIGVLHRQGLRGALVDTFYAAFSQE